MSQASNRQLTMLAAMSGCLHVLLLPGVIGAVHMKTHIKSTKELVDKTIHNWEASGNDVKNFTKIAKVIFDWNASFDNHKRIKLDSAVLSYICVILMEDMRLKAKNRNKVAMLNGLKVPLEHIHSFTDREGRNILAQNYADILIGELHDLSGWEWD